MGSQLLSEVGKLVTELCWQVMLKVVGETNWLFVKEARESRQSLEKPAVACILALSS